MVVPTQNPIGSAAWRSVPLSLTASFFWDTARGTSVTIIARNRPAFFLTSVILGMITVFRLPACASHFGGTLVRYSRGIASTNERLSRVFFDHFDLLAAEFFAPSAYGPAT